MSLTIRDSFAPWSLTPEAVIDELQSDAQLGLTSSEAAERLAQFGRNELPEPPPDPLWLRYWRQLTGDAVVRLLLIGAIVSLLLQDYLEGGAILAMLNIMAGFGLWQEGRATDAARSLRSTDEPLKLVFRDGVRKEIPVAEIVPGDIVYLPTGAIPPADGRAIAASNAEKADAALTGEGPKSVKLHIVDAHAVVNSQDNMLFRGCPVVAGNVTMVVTSTGPKTRIGRIAEGLAGIKDVRTPLDEQLDDLGDTMARIFIWVAAAVIAVGLGWKVHGYATDTFAENATMRQVAETIIGDLKESFITAVALIIAAIPEGLPAVLTITLAIATKVMVKRQALVRKPKAVEGGGSMTVLLTDKTGTLTANQMESRYLYINGNIHEIGNGQAPPEGGEALQRAMQVAAFCNNTSGSTELALARWVEQIGFSAHGDVQSRAVEHVFDQGLKRMTTIHSTRTGNDLAFTKGAPELVLDLCTSIHMDGHDRRITDADRRSVESAIKELASRGLRVLALADRRSTDMLDLSREEVETNLTFVGLIGIMDPPRDDVPGAVRELTLAGIRTVMVTGDNPLTAYHVSKMVGIIEHDMPFDDAVITGEELDQLDNPTPQFLQRLQTVRVFARVTPEHKEKIVHAMQNAGFIVGMTGDGVNDALALKASDVGFAMGNGTDVAREAGDVVLMDSRFGTIPHAVEEGRNVLYRIRLYLSYILSGNGCEVGALLVASLLHWPLPLTALVLLVINFATDSFPALAMAFEPGEKDVMRQPPRQRDLPFINREMWMHIAVQSVVATIAIIVVYGLALEQFGRTEADADVARSAAFMTYIFQKLIRAFTARSLKRYVWEIGFFANRWSIGAVAISMSIALISVYTPVLNTAMGLAHLPADWLLICLGVGLLPPIAEEITKWYVQKSTRPLNTQPV